MRGRTGPSGFLQTDYRISRRDPSSVGFAATFSPKREKENHPDSPFGRMMEWFFEART